MAASHELASHELERAVQLCTSTNHYHAHKLIGAQHHCTSDSDGSNIVDSTREIKSKPMASLHSTEANATAPSLLANQTIGKVASMTVPAAIDWALNKRFSADDIRGKQRQIHREVLQLSRTMERPNFSRVAADDLKRMIVLYDREFFDSQMLRLIGVDRIRFGWSSRMTRVAGKLITHNHRKRRRFVWSKSVDDRQFEMVLSSTLLFQAFHDVDRPIKVTGILCRDRIEAMQRVCEHELIHLIEMFLWNDGSCSGPRFQGIANRFFSHTEHRHDLITQAERAARNFDIRVGSQVRFRHHSKVLTGRVNRITRRATVLVEDPTGERFTDGKRYVRFYVPLEQLRLVG